MSKKKNTLQDLNDFLKQQAATLVSPDKLGGEKFPESMVDKAVEEAAVQSPVQEISVGKIIHDLKSLSKKEDLPVRKKLYDLILHTLEDQQHTSPEDKLLINTALYLKHGENWKEKISEYWRNK